MIKVIKAYRMVLYEIVHVSSFFLIGGAEIVNAKGSSKD